LDGVYTCIELADE